MRKASSINRPWAVLAMAGVITLAWAGGAAAAVELITNGGFEAGGGSLTGWTVVNQANGSGNWFLQSGTGSPTNAFVVPAPPEGTHAAMTDQTGPGSHVMYQTFVVPNSVTLATLSFERYIRNNDGSFTTNANLDFSGIANTQARVDVMTAAAGDFSVAAGDVLANVFHTQPADPLISGYTLVTADLTALFQAHAGQTLRLRFAEVDNQSYFDFGVDAISLKVTADPPGPAVPLPRAAGPMALGAAMVLGLAVRARRARAPAC